MKKTFVIDWWLMGAFVLSAVSGIGFHIAGHRCCHVVWHDWAVVHVVTSLAFAVLAAVHVRQHWEWYKGLVKSGFGKRSKVTAVFSGLFAVCCVTGLVLPGVAGAMSGVGIWHYRIGLAVAVIAVGHIVKRVHILLK